MYQSRWYNYYPSYFPPKFSAVVMRKSPGIHIFHGASCPVSRHAIDAFGQCFHIILPPISIVIGMSKSQININHQNHMKSTSTNSNLFASYYSLSSLLVANSVLCCLRTASPQGIGTQASQGSVAPLAERDSETFSIMFAVHLGLFPAAFDILSDTDPDRPC